MIEMWGREAYNMNGEKIGWRDEDDREANYI